MPSLRTVSSTLSIRYVPSRLDAEAETNAQQLLDLPLLITTTQVKTVTETKTQTTSVPTTKTAVYTTEVTKTATEIQKHVETTTHTKDIIKTKTYISKETETYTTKEVKTETYKTKEIKTETYKHEPSPPPAPPSYTKPYQPPAPPPTTENDWPKTTLVTAHKSQDHGYTSRDDNYKTKSDWH